MENLGGNNLIRFVNVSRKKEGIFVNFKVKGVKGGTKFSASLSVDLAATELDPSHSLEEIIEQCARIAVKDFKRSEFQFEGLSAV